MQRVLAMAFLVSLVCQWNMMAESADLVLVDGRVSRAPIVLAKDAGPETAQAANDLAQYLEKISGARPTIVTGDADPTPEHAIWIGGHPRLSATLPDVKLDFTHPEEILIACNGRHLVLAGRDRKVGDKQIEFGTVNAVYTFLQKYLEVRWLWPGPLGEDVIRRDTVSLPPCVYRFHPPFRVRHFSPGQPKDWYRYQRLQPLYSLQVHAGHAFGTWWDAYHQEHPDYFALQPDGSRDAYPSPKNVKLCVSNPRMQAQWLADAKQVLRTHPEQGMVSASPNDGALSGHCVCADCRAWDNPKGQAVTLYGKGGKSESVALTDRYIKFSNLMARALRERLPDREIYVGVHAYGPYMTPPVAELPDRNVAVSYVGHFPLTSDALRQEQKAEWKGWADKASLLVYRPNLWYWAGGVWGLPEVAMQKTIEDFHFLADHRCVGLQVDTVRGHWATQGPQYYLMAQLAYDPCQDGAAVLKDYYRRGFGAAAAEIERYWSQMESARDTIVNAPDFQTGSRNRFKLPALFARVYTDAFFQQAEDILRQADTKVAAGPAVYHARVAFVRSGLAYTRLLMQNVPLMARLRESRGKDAAAVSKVLETWDAMEKLSKQAGPFAIGHSAIAALIQGKAYMGGMQDYFGPPSDKFRKAAGLPSIGNSP